MGRSRMQAALSPPGLIIEQVRLDDAGFGAMARSRDAGAICPTCGAESRRIHRVTSVNEVENPGVAGAAMVMRPWCLG